jgi:phytoene dehydrogenase-like protein
MSEQSAIIIGGGHNGLVCAFYLARAGVKVIVLERRAVLGGAAVTEEFFPGFRNSTASYTVSLLNPKVIEDLELARHGLKIIDRPLSNFLPVNEREYLAGPSPSEIAKFSAKDAESLRPYTERLQTIADVLRELILKTPPNVVAGGWRDALPELIKTVRVGRRLAKLSLDGKRDLVALFAQSGGDWLDGWFESDPIKALFGFDAIVGNYASPYTPGSAYVLLHHAFGETNGAKGTWGHAVGGMGAIAEAMAKAAREKGAELRIKSPVAEVLIENNRAVGVRTEKGETFRAPVVVSNLNPRLLFGRLVPKDAQPADFSARIGRYRCASGTFRMNVALAELPRFACHPEPGLHLASGIIMGPSLSYMDRAFSDAKANGWSREPIIEMLIPSVVDETLGPKGRHVASLFCQHAAPHLSDGRSWDDHRDEVANVMLDTVERFAPGFRKSVIGMQALSPLDLERVFGLVEGDIMHGRLDLDQMFSARPMLGHGNYRSPIGGLYMCGAGTHPGGGVTGAPGHNAAREILKDLRRRRL